MAALLKSIWKTIESSKVLILKISELNNNKIVKDSGNSRINKTDKILAKFKNIKIV